MRLRMVFSRRQWRYGISYSYPEPMEDYFSLQGEGVVIVDAGGGTIDVSTYKRVEKESKRTFAEIAVPQCNVKTSVFFPDTMFIIE